MAGKKSNPKKKERCKSAWLRGQDRKKQLISEAQARRDANAAAGETPWQRAQAARAEARKDLTPQNRDDLNFIISVDGRRIYDTKRAVAAAIEYKAELTEIIERRNKKARAKTTGVSVTPKKGRSK